MSRQTDAYAAIESASAPAFTRDGRTLLHLRGAGLPQIWALDLDSLESRQITHHDEKVAFFRRCPVDDRVIYGIDKGGDERQQLWLVDPASPAPRPLTDALDVIHEWGGWSPDGTHFALSANSRDPAQFDVFVQDIASGERRCVLRTEGIATSSGFRSDGTRLAVIVDRGQGDQDLLLVDAHAHAAGPGSPTSSGLDSPDPLGLGLAQSSWPGLTRPSRPDLCGTGSPRTVLDGMAGVDPIRANITKQRSFADAFSWGARSTDSRVAEVWPGLSARSAPGRSPRAARPPASLSAARPRPGFGHGRQGGSASSSLAVSSIISANSR